MHTILGILPIYFPSKIGIDFKECSILGVVTLPLKLCGECRKQKEQVIKFPNF